MAVLAAGACLAAGCGGGDDNAEAPTKSSTQTRGTTGGNDTLQGASTRDVRAEARNTKTALLTAVRAAQHDGYDRVVFEFRNTLPGYDVGYVERPITADTSGVKVQVKGGPVVQVVMRNALDADLNGASVVRTYTGPNRFTPQTPEVAELVRTGAFEAVLTWVVGLNDRADFRVLTLRDPPRLAVDFRSH